MGLWPLSLDLMELKMIALGFTVALFTESSERAPCVVGMGWGGHRRTTVNTSELREDSGNKLKGSVNKVTNAHCSLATKAAWVKNQLRFDFCLLNSLLCEQP